MLTRRRKMPDRHEVASWVAHVKGKTAMLNKYPSSFLSYKVQVIYQGFFVKVGWSQFRIRVSLSMDELSAGNNSIAHRLLSPNPEIPAKYLVK